MGLIKCKMHEIADKIIDAYGEGIPNELLDNYLKGFLSENDFGFYMANKEAIITYFVNAE